MAKTPKPWFRKKRKTWYVCINGVQYNLGRDKKAAFQEYGRLMQQPVDQKQISGQSLVYVIDKFLEWVQVNRAPDTFTWYRDLLQKFAEVYSTTIGRVSLLANLGTGGVGDRASVTETDG